MPFFCSDAAPPAELNSQRTNHFRKIRVLTQPRSTPEVLIDRRPSEKIYLRSCTLIIDPCPAQRRKRIGQVLFAHHPQSAQRPRVREDKIEQPTRGAFDRSSIRFNRLIELDLATRRFTGFDGIYHI